MVQANGSYYLYTYLLNVYKTFVRYGNIIFDKPNKESFNSRTESIQ